MRFISSDFHSRSPKIDKFDFKNYTSFDISDFTTQRTAENAVNMGR